jgi:hypothetical protein
MSITIGIGIILAEFSYREVKREREQFGSLGVKLYKFIKREHRSKRLW